MRTKFHYCFIGLAFLAGVHSAFAQVINLGIAQDGKQSVLYWPNSPTNYVLQTVTNLSSTNWVTARDTVTVYAAGRGGDAGAPSWLMLATTDDGQSERQNDDGEPSGRLSLALAKTASVDGPDARFLAAAECLPW